MHLDAPICSNTAICPQCSPVHLHVLGVSACDWGMQGALLFGNPPCVWMPPHVSNIPCIYMLSCMSVCSRGYCMCYGGNILNVGGLGTSAHLSGFWCLVCTSTGCPLCFILYLSCSSLCLKSLLPLLQLLLLQ